MCIVTARGGALAERALAWVWLTPEYVERFVLPRAGLQAAHANLDAMTRLAGFAVSMIPLAVLFYALHQAYQLFDAYRAGEIFPEGAAERLRRIGLAMIAIAVLKPVTGALLSIVLTYANPPGGKMLVLGIGLDDYMTAAFGGLIVAIGHVMSEAQRLADAHRQIV